MTVRPLVEPGRLYRRRAAGRLSTDDATWDDLLRLIYEQQRVYERIAGLEAGRSWTSDQIHEKLDIPRVRVVWSDRALKSLANIHTRSASEVSGDQANKVVEGVPQRGDQLETKAQELLDILAEDPFQKPPSFEKLVGDLSGAYSRRINIQHRLVYQVLEEERVVKVLRLWSHYE